MSLILSNGKYNKKLRSFVENITEIIYKPKYENPLLHSESGKIKYLQQKLNKMNALIILLVMSCVGSQLELLRISWYKNIKTFRINMKLVMKKYLCSLYEYLPGVDYSSNDVMLIEMSKYISSYNLNTISIDFYICF